MEWEGMGVKRDPTHGDSHRPGPTLTIQQEFDRCILGARPPQQQQHRRYRHRRQHWQLHWQPRHRPRDRRANDGLLWRCALGTHQRSVSASIGSRIGSRGIVRTLSARARSLLCERVVVRER
jgi:hypothetical protein